ncbi:unnamed protein product [Ectocarpus sp. 12 AP-2014]
MQTILRPMYISRKCSTSEPIKSWGEHQQHTAVEHRKVLRKGANLVTIRFTRSLINKSRQKRKKGPCAYVHHATGYRKSSGFISFSGTSKHTTHGFARAPFK